MRKNLSRLAQASYKSRWARQLRVWTRYLKKTSSSRKRSWATESNYKIWTLISSNFKPIISDSSKMASQLHYLQIWNRKGNPRRTSHLPQGWIDSLQFRAQVASKPQRIPRDHLSWSPYPVVKSELYREEKVGKTDESPKKRISSKTTWSACRRSQTCKSFSTE